MMAKIEIVTPMGCIVIALELDRAPRSAGAFLQVVEDYDGGMTFWRAGRMQREDGVLLLDIVQGGVVDPAGFNTVPHEPTSQTGLSHVAGAVALCRSDAVGAIGAAFYFCLEDMPLLDAGAWASDDLGYAVFGHVVEGMEVLQAIRALPCGEAAPMEILRGQVLRDPVAILAMRRV